jgi:hypothetical protein
MAIRSRFVDRDGATWEVCGPLELRCLHDPDADPDDWFPGLPVPVEDVIRLYGPLDFAEAVDSV